MISRNNANIPYKSSELSQNTNFILGGMFVDNLSTAENGLSTPKKSENGVDPTKKQTMTTAVKRRKHMTPIPTIDLEKLKSLEGSTASSFLALAKAVILIDGTPYNETTLPLSNARKIDFQRLISHHAKLEIHGKRRYHIKCVVERKRIEADNDIPLIIQKKDPYTTPKPLSAVEKENKRLLYKAKKEALKAQQQEADEKDTQKTADKIEKIKQGATDNTPPK